jgi:SAM-dependent methyltransferase
LILPGTIRLVQPTAGMRVLDVGCGQGIVSRALAALGAEAVGIDASPGLIEAAKTRGSEGGRARYGVGDAGSLAAAVKAMGSEREGPFDVAVCVMALGNIEPLEPVFRGVASLLKPGGKFVAVISHPAFRAPGQTSWGFDEQAGAQFRRVDGYLSAGQHQVQMHPGLAALGKAGGDATTWSFHRPLQTYVRLLGSAGLLIETMEEWTSRRTSQPGPKAAAENRARREIPLFLAWRGVRV